MKMNAKLFIYTIVAGFALAQAGCGAETMPPKPNITVSPAEQTLLDAIVGAGGSADRDEEDNINMIYLSTGGPESNVTDAWIDKNLENLKKQTKLENLALRGSQVTKKRIEALKKELPKVEISSDFDE